jgi:hypothetical protein
MHLPKAGRHRRTQLFSLAQVCILDIGCVCGVKFSGKVLTSLDVFSDMSTDNFRLFIEVLSC